MGALSDAVTGVFDAIGIKDWADSTFRGATIVAVNSSIVRMYKPSLNINSIKQVAISSILENQQLVPNVLNLAANNYSIKAKQAMDYAYSRFNLPEIQNYINTVSNLNSAFNTELTNYKNSIDNIITSTDFLSNVSLYETQTAKIHLVNTLSAKFLAEQEAKQEKFIAEYPVPEAPSEGATKEEIAAYENAVAERNQAITDNWNILYEEYLTYKLDIETTYELLPTEEYEALNLTIQNTAAAIASLAKPEYGMAPTKPTGYYYGYPLIITDGLPFINPFPVIPIKERGTYLRDISATDPLYTDTIKMSKYFGFELDPIIDDVKSQDTDGSIKTVAVVQLVDLTSKSVAAKNYITELFIHLAKTNLPKRTQDDPGIVAELVETGNYNSGTFEQELVCASYDNHLGVCTDYEYPQVAHPYSIKTEEGYFNITMKLDSINKSIVTSNLKKNECSVEFGLEPITKTLFTNYTTTEYKPEVLYVTVRKGLGDGTAIEVQVKGLTVMSYIDEGNGIEMDILTLDNTTATDDSIPYPLPLFIEPYNNLSVFNKHDILRESSHIVVFSGVHKNLTWAETNAGLVQFAMIVIAIATMNPSSFAGGSATTTAIGSTTAATTTYYYTAASILSTVAVTAVTLLAVKAVITNIFPDNPLAQALVVVVAAYIVTTMALDTLSANATLADKILAVVPAVSNVVTTAMDAIYDVKSEYYSKELQELTEQYEEEKKTYEEILGEFSAMDNLTEASLLRRNYVNSNKPVESVNGFYARTLNQNPGIMAYNYDAMLSTNLTPRLLV